MDYKEIWKRGFHLGCLFDDHAWDDPDCPSSQEQEILDEKGLPYFGYYQSRRLEDTQMGPGNYFNQYTHFRKKIYSGKWIVIGYESPRRPNSKLQIMPKDVLEAPTFDFENSGISGDGLAYTGLRVVHHSLMKDFRPSQKNSPGRPTHIEHIIGAYERLRDQGEIDFSAPLNALYEPIRNIVAMETQTPLEKLKGIGNEAIRKKIRTFFNADRGQ